MGQKFKKLKIDVFEIALDQWNERVRRYLANEICLFALFPRALLLLINITTVVYKNVGFKFQRPILRKLEIVAFGKI